MLSLMTIQSKILNLLRIGLGWIFLWAFLDKVWGLGFSTADGKAWIDGVSPTTGFLKFGVDGPFTNTFQSMAGQPIVDWLYMLGLLLVGTALVLGIATRLAAIGGTIMMLLIFFAASIPPEHNPVIDEHIIYILSLWLLAASPETGNWLGLGRWWHNLLIVQRFPILK